MLRCKVTGGACTGARGLNNSRKRRGSSEGREETKGSASGPLTVEVSEVAFQPGPMAYRFKGLPSKSGVSGSLCASAAFVGPIADTDMGAGCGAFVPPCGASCAWAIAIHPTPAKHSSVAILFIHTSPQAMKFTASRLSSGEVPEKWQALPIFSKFGQVQLGFDQRFIGSRIGNDLSVRIHDQ